jgi:hypothetical protein
MNRFIGETERLREITTLVIEKSKKQREEYERLVCLHYRLSPRAMHQQYDDEVWCYAPDSVS